MSRMKYWFILATVLIAKIMSETAGPNDQFIITHAHNHYRILQGASNMNRLVWDDNLAQVADDWVNSCQHGPLQTSRGQNLYVGRHYSDLFEWAMGEWYDQSIWYNYDEQDCHYYCDDFKQMVWANTQRIGCAAHFCEKANLSYFNNNWFIGCLYDPAGNVAGQTPFISGPACSRCSAGQSCVNDLCT